MSRSRFVVGATALPHQLGVPGAHRVTVRKHLLPMIASTWGKIDTLLTRIRFSTGMRRLVILCGLLTTVAAAAPMNLKVMTYNIRYDEPKDPFVWDERLAPLSELIVSQQPDVLGVQEALRYQVSDLAKKLQDYAWVGVGRGPDNPKMEYSEKAGEFNPIFYRKDRFEALGSGTFWLSATPDKAGSFGPGFGLPRISTWAKLHEKTTGKTFFAFNTHLPYESGERGRRDRRFALQTLLSKLSGMAGSQSVILTGDFNSDSADAGERTAVHSLLEKGFQDAARAPKRSGPDNTFYGFEVNNKNGARLDYIWVSRAPAVTLNSYRVLDNNNGKYYFSDHLPVVAEVTLP